VAGKSVVFPSHRLGEPHLHIEKGGEARRGPVGALARGIDIELAGLVVSPKGDAADDGIVGRRLVRGKSSRCDATRGGGSEGAVPEDVDPGDRHGGGIIRVVAGDIRRDGEAVDVVTVSGAIGGVGHRQGRIEDGVVGVVRTSLGGDDGGVEIDVEGGVAPPARAREVIGRVAGPGGIDHEWSGVELVDGGIGAVGVPVPDRAWLGGPADGGGSVERSVRITHEPGGGVTDLGDGQLNRGVGEAPRGHRGSGGRRTGGLVRNAGEEGHHETRQDDQKRQNNDESRSGDTPLTSSGASGGGGQRGSGEIGFLGKAVHGGGDPGIPIARVEDQERMGL